MNNVINLTRAKYLGDITASEGVQIQIRADGLVVWVNVDGVCVARILTNGLTAAIEIEDGRKEVK